MAAVAISGNELDHVLRFIERYLQPAGETLEQLRQQLLAAHDTIYANGRKYYYGFVSRASQTKTMARLRHLCDDDVSALNRLFDLDFGECFDDDWDEVAASYATILEPRIKSNGAVRDTLLRAWWSRCTPELVGFASLDVNQVRAMVQEDATALTKVYESALCGIEVEQPLTLHTHLECSASEQAFVALAASNAHLTPVTTWYVLLLAYLARRVDRGMPVFRKRAAQVVPPCTINWLIDDYYNSFSGYGREQPVRHQEDAALRQLSEHWGRGYTSRRAVVSTSPSSFFCDLASFCTCVESERRSRIAAPTGSELLSGHGGATAADQTLHTETKSQPLPRAAHPPINASQESGRKQSSSA